MKRRGKSDSLVGSAAMLLKRITWLTFSLLLAVSSSAWAVSPKDVVTARSTGLGGSRGIASANSAIFLNPAALGATRQYTAQFDYLHSTNPDAGGGGDAIVLSIADSLSNPMLPTGIAYRYMSLGPQGDNAKGWITDFALGIPLTQSFLLGARVSYLSYELGGEELSKFTGDLGGLLVLDYLQLGVVGFNLLKVDSPEAARGVAVSLSLTDSISWRLGGDVRWEWPGSNVATSWGAGAEYLLGRAFPVRAGFEYDAMREAKFWSVGTGLVFQQFGIDVSYRHDLATGTAIWAFGGKLFQ